MEEISCPKCGYNNVRRSHTHGVYEKTLRILGWRAFQCREQSCRWRGLIRTKEIHENIVKEAKKFKNKYSRYIIIFTIFIIIIIIGFLLFIRLTNYEPVNESKIPLAVFNQSIIG
jgi:hypothetical protein